MHAAQAAEGTPWVCTLPEVLSLCSMALLHLACWNLQTGGVAAQGIWLDGRIAPAEGSQGPQHVTPDAALADDACYCVSCQMTLTVCSMAFLRMT